MIVECNLFMCANAVETIYELHAVSLRWHDSDWWLMQAGRGKFWNSTWLEIAFDPLFIKY